MIKDLRSKTLKHSLKILNFKLRIGVLLVVGSFILLVAVSNTMGQAGEVRTFTITPPAIEVNLDPGEYTEGEMKLINDSSEPLTFNVTIQDFIVEDNAGTPKLLVDDVLDNKYSAANWIGVAPTTFTIQPREQQVMNYFIRVPADARPGGRYAAAVLRNINPIELDATGATVATSLGTLFYINIEGDINENAKVIRFGDKRFHEYGPANIITEILNLGDLHIRPKGSITVTDLFGRRVDQESLRETNIFPEASRVFDNNLGHKFMIGRYKASLLASYGKNDNLPLAAEFYFWVFPWKIAIVVALATLALILGTLYVRKRGRKREDTENSENSENQTVR